MPPASFENLRLRTARLSLRPYERTDAEALYAIFSDAQVARYLSRPAWTDLAEARERIEQDITGMAAGEHLRFALERTEDGALLGDCCLFKLMKQSRRAELGYTLARTAWGHGYMNEALQALVELAFTTLDLNRLEADIDPRNAASERSLLRLGFVKEGHLRERWIVAGEVSDTGLYGLLRSDWQRR
jgi:ribosomal-protein-alanine N-acetyltransferase